MDANGMIKLPAAGFKDTGIAWDMPSNQITNILIWYGEDIINAIQFQYVKDGRLVVSELHGCTTAAEDFTAVTINHPSEYIIELSGQWYPFAIRCLTIVTNLHTHQNIGKRIHFYHGNRIYHEFRFKIGRGQEFGGFHGTFISQPPAAGLRSIGVYLKLPTTLDELNDHGTLRSVKKEKT